MATPNVFEALLQSLKAHPDLNQPTMAAATLPAGQPPPEPLSPTTENWRSVPLDGLAQLATSLNAKPDAATPVVQPGAAAPASLPAALPPVVAQRAPESANAPDMASPDDQFAALLAQAAQTPQHGDARDKLSAEQSALMAKSNDAKNMSDQEKIGMAIIAALPGLLGALGGGAVAGGYGAAAGLAGGLTGSAQGINAIAAGKEAQRKEAKTDAEKVAERIAHLDEQIAAEKEKSSDRTLSMQIQERSAQRAMSLEGKKMEQAKLLADANNRTQLTATALHEKGAMDRAQLEAQVSTNKALLTAKQSGADLKDYQGKATQFATSMLVAKDDLDKMQDPSIWNTMTTWSGLQSALSDPARQKYARAAFNFIDAVTRDVSGAAITPDEWTTKFRQYLPSTGSSPQDMQAARNYRDSALNTMLAKAGPGRDIAIQSYQMVSQPQQTEHSPQTSAGPHGQVVTQGGHTYVWNGSEYIAK